MKTIQLLLKEKTKMKKKMFTPSSYIHPDLPIICYVFIPCMPSF